MDYDDARVTEDDIADLNRTSLRTTATIGRYAGAVLVVLGVVGVAAWLWVVVRQQGLFGGQGRVSFGGLDNASFTQRIDLFSTSITILMSSALLAGVGFGIRLVSELLLTRTGGSLSGVEVGQVVEVDDLAADAGRTEGAGDDANWAP